MGRTTALLSLALASLISRPQARADDPPPPDTEASRLEFFEGKVRPVLEAHCINCHGPDKQKAGLRLDSREALVRGGDSGPAIEPGQPEASRLIEAVNHSADIQMPPKGRLKEQEVANLTRWVREGAPWTESTAEVRPAAQAETGKVTDEDRAFWAFRPVNPPAIPTAGDEAWGCSPIDRFVLAELKAKGLHPVAPADRRALIRRATFDLIGLPPTPEEVEAFANDPAPDAFAKVVDRLLANPHYGERWGRHWLDVARYGEDQAHTFEARLYPNGYKYRDWVTQALNDDMPYDRFVVEQIAGDLIEGPGRDERQAALGFFALGPVYYGGAVFDELDDRVDTLSRGFLGLTVSCARCHDHKFDPIPTSDYYALAGIFSSTAYKEYPTAPPEIVEAYDKAQAEIKAKTAEVASFVKAESARWAESAAGTQSARYIVGAWTLANLRKAKPDLSTGDFAKGENLDTFLLDRWLKYLEPRPDDHRAHLEGWRKLVEGQDARADLSGLAEIKAEVARIADEFQARVRTTQALRDVFGIAKPEAEFLQELTSKDGLFALPKNEVENHLADDVKVALKAKQADLKKLKSDAPAKYPVVHSLTDGSKPADMKVFLRGNPATPGSDAPRRFLTVLSPEESAPFNTQGSGRLELARAIANPENPLTARVMVNRVWEHHFGRGLVGTPSNFGKMGERPSHPALLDYLARRFVDQGWSLKTLHREIMLSSTYQLAATDDPSNAEVDPANILLWRANRRRLEVEAWRDAMLAVSGRLDPAIGGPSTDLASPDNQRRTCYAKVSRHNLDGLLRLFDFPDPNITADKRTVTAVPLQQLFVLNSEFMERQARALAARLTEGDGDVAEKVRRAFPLLYARPATDPEVSMAVEFLEAADEPKAPLSRWEQYAQVLLGANEFLFLD
ncbi:PSD1 and planctomycete cytochrome C domain-containing protein [Tundrisphaera lichenicola]|uniref:PSD1 and planctomycete cytochrome C domain-containing protein n=1 Tax=Tundrisphaera lichenicola TaxID=2029860 RepID=UPI003EBBAC88